MDIEKKKELVKLMNQLEERRKLYAIRSFKPQKHQQPLIDAIKERIIINEKISPKYKYLLFQWWNGSGKSAIGLYAVASLALWELCVEYWIPYIWSRKHIWIVTKSWINVKSVIMPYLVGNYWKTRIPPEVIAKTISDNWLLKWIELKNWNKIEILTYDQWRERLQGWNPDFILVDEEPTNKEIWDELMVRTRVPKCQMVLTMTPLSWLTPVYEFFYEQDIAPWVEDRRIKFLVSSLENEYVDNSWLFMLNEQDRKMRIYWLFVPPSGLVFSSFIRQEHVISSFNPKDLGPWTKFYWWIDFWVTHPTAFLLMAMDIDGNIFVFDWFKESNLHMSEIADKIKEKIRKWWIELEWIVWDSAAKRERIELKKLGVSTQPADKWSKGENWESNRKAWIFKMNQLFFNNKLYISEELKTFIQELEQHHYKDWWKKDGEVEKTGDDYSRLCKVYYIFYEA